MRGWCKVGRRKLKAGLQRAASPLTGGTLSGGQVTGAQPPILSPSSLPPQAAQDTSATALGHVSHRLRSSPESDIIRAIYANRMDSAQQEMRTSLCMQRN